MRKVFIALAGAAALTFGSASQAAITVTSCTFSTSCAVDNQPSSSTIAFSEINLASPSFTETVNFTNDVAGLYSITFGTSSPSVDILTAMLMGPGGTTFNLTGPTGTLPNKQYNLAQTFLPTGAFSFTTTGTHTAGQAGSIAGTLSVNSAVPEPATWGLMLLGFGGMGFSMRRNRRRTAIAQIA